jgi:hypothetical protein
MNDRNTWHSLRCVSVSQAEREYREALDALGRPQLPLLLQVQRAERRRRAKEDMQLYWFMLALGVTVVTAYLVGR